MRITTIKSTKLDSYGFKWLYKTTTKVFKNKYTAIETIGSGCKPLEIIDDGTRFVDDGKLHTVHFDISREVERIMREINKEIDDEVFKRLSKEKLIKLRERIDKEIEWRENLLKWYHIEDVDLVRKVENEDNNN